MARATRDVEIEALTESLLDALEAAAANPSLFSRETAEPGIISIATGIVDWVRAREDSDLEVSLSGVSVSGSTLTGTGTIT